MNIKNHRLMGDNEDHFVIHDGEAEFKIAKYMIDPSTHKKIESMERHENFSGGGMVKGYADGGKVGQSGQYRPEMGQALGEMFPKLPEAEELAKIPELQKSVESAPPEPVQVYPEAVGPAKTPQETPLKAPPQKPPVQGPALPSAEQKVEAGNNAVIKASDDYANAYGEAGKAASKAYFDASKALQEHNKKFMAEKESLNFQTQQLHDDILNQKINPNQVWENTSAPNKILASLGIILGGIGGGMSGTGKNMALEQINKTIDADIDAQKANLNNKQSLLSRNLDRYKDMMIAEEVTRNQLMAPVTAQISALEASNIGPRAKLEAAKLKNEMQQNMLKGNNELAKTMMAYQQAAGQGTPEALLQSPELAKTAVKLPGTGKYSSAKTPEDAKRLNDVITNSQNAIDIIKKIEKMGSAVYGPGSSEEAAAEVAKLDAALMSVYGKEGNLKEGALKVVREMREDPTGLKNRLGLGSDKKMGNLVSDIQNRRDNELSQGLIDYKKPVKADAPIKAMSPKASGRQ